MVSFFEFHLLVFEILLQRIAAVLALECVLIQSGKIALFLKY